MKSWGYDPLFLSVDQKSGLSSLEETLEGQTTVIVGPSGVGKSSLINALRSNQNISEEDPIHKLVEQVAIMSFISFTCFNYFNNYPSTLTFYIFSDCFFALCWVTN